MMRNLALLAATVVVVGCSTPGPAPGAAGPEAPAPTAAPAAGGDGGELTIRMDEFLFDPGPAATQSGLVTFHVVNDGEAPHQLAVSRLGEAHDHHLVDTGEMAAGERRSVTVELAPGTYEIACHVPGHFEAGMVTTLTVVG